VYIPPYQASPTYVQRINVTNVTNITVQIIERTNVNKTVYANRSIAQALTFVPHDVFVRSQPAAGHLISVSKAELEKAPLLGMTAKLAPQRESVLVQPLAPKSPVAQPLPSLEKRRVYSRTAPPPPPVPFSKKQDSLKANPGRPLDKEALVRLQNTQPPAEPKVMVANSSKLHRVEPPTNNKEPAKAPAPPVGNKGPVITPAIPTTRQPADTASGNRASSDVAALINTLKTQSLPDADRQLAEARKVANIRLDFNAVAQQLSKARTALAGAERDLASGNTSRAQQTAAAVRKQIEEQMRIISAAIKAAKR
jgi:hypothetical protein